MVMPSIHPHDKFLALVQHPVKFRLFLMAKLPAAYFSGVRVKAITAQQSVVTVPYKWFSQNPFKSTYFACLAMAAEMSTGLLAMMHTYHSNPPVSMLVVELQANYYKKATAKTFFTCEDGSAIAAAIQQAVSSGQGVTIKVKATGTNQGGEPVADFFITWSFKAKLPTTNH
jgi:acyl-coenzyme A thioesterase PaaI-like protein